MTILRNERPAFGKPGTPPRWTRSDKQAVGTAYSASSRVWFTLSAGILNEIYYPTIDQPQTRDLQYLVTDGATFFQDERQLETTLTELTDHALGFQITNSDPQKRYRIVKEVIAAPHEACVLVHTRLEGTLLSRLRLFALLAPHLEVGGWGNTGNVTEVAGRRILTAHKGSTWLALGATIPFRRLSCGYVGASDGWTDLHGDFEMDWEFDVAEDGNVALAGELDLSRGREFTLGLAFGKSLHNAITTLFESLGVPFAEQKARFTEQWDRTCGKVRPLRQSCSDGGNLYLRSHSLLLAHEDKLFPGAMIASLSIPWGEFVGDENLGGYHLVWTRDLVQGTTGLLASDNTETPFRALIYLACCQRDDGGFYQNFWINGEPYWRGIQLDEVAFPTLLAWRLRELNALRDFDPYPMVLGAAGYLVRYGPATLQERWEEDSGYSPSTLAVHIAGLVCAADFARQKGDDATARFLLEYADFLECHVEPWTVTTEGTLVPGIKRHYIRILPVEVDNPDPDEDPNRAVVPIRNRKPGDQVEFPAKDIVDAGFLELVRFGVRKAGDPLMEDSLRVVDAVLKVDTPLGPCWHRYNHDGYGQRDDGGAFNGWGVGRAWPLLTGERGHYELAAGRDARPYLQAMEKFAIGTGLIPEQVWDEPDRPEIHMYLGRPTGSAMPLMWAHAEYIKLLRSLHDGRVFDLVPPVAERYGERKGVRPLEVWKPNRHARSVRAGTTLRVLALEPFRLHHSRDGWQHKQDTTSTGTVLGVEYVDLPTTADARAPLTFTFFWTSTQRWEGQDYQVEVVPGA
jgi:glucoamylase